MNNTPDSPAKPPDDRTDQGGNYWTLFTPGIWKVLHAVLDPGAAGRHADRPEEPDQGSAEGLRPRPATGPQPVLRATGDRGFAGQRAAGCVCSRLAGGV